MIPAWLIKYGGGLLGLALIVWGVHNHGYTAGVRDEKAIWTPQLIAAEKAKAEADARAESLTAASNALSAQYEARHAETLHALNTRYADADRRLRALSVRLSAANSSRCEVRTVPNPAAVPDDAAASESSAERAGIRIADVGRRCESDALTLTELQDWIRQQASLRTGP